MYGRLTPEDVQWLATARMVDGQRRLSTFLDEGLAANWGSAEPRRLWDGGCFVEHGDGMIQRQAGEPGAMGAGAFSVRIGPRSFTCLRVIDVEQADEARTLVEAYLAESGRTILFRRYNGRLWRSGPAQAPWDEALPGHQRLVVDGAVFVHWYDCLTGLACGVE